MALSIGVVPGSKIKINSATLEVLEIVGADKMMYVSLDGGPEIELNVRRRVMLLPGVFASYGHKRSIAFEAHQAIKIARIHEYPVEA